MRLSLTTTGTNIPISRAAICVLLFSLPPAVAHAAAHAPLQLRGGIQFAGHPFRIPLRLGCFQGLKQLLRFLAAFQGCLIIPLLLLPCRARQGKVGFVKSVSGIAKGRCSRQEHAEQGTG